MAREKVETNITYDDVKNKYYVSLYYGVDKNGKAIRKFKTTNSLKEAKALLKEFTKNKAKDNIVNPKSVTLEQYINYWLYDIKKIRVESTTLYGYENIVNNHIIPEIGIYKLQEVDSKILNKYFSKKLKTLSPNTIRKHYDLLGDVIRIAINEDLLLKNPLDRVEKIKKERPERNIYDKEKLIKLMDIIKDNLRMELIIAQACILGMRREEICGLTWDNINLTERELRIKNVITQAGSKSVHKQAKSSDSERGLYIPDMLYDILIKVQEQQSIYKEIYKDRYDTGNYVLSWENGSHYRPNYISDIFKKTIDDNGLPPTRLHDLRHAFASVANDEGVSIYDISQALGHRDIRITAEIYTHMFDKTKKRAINTVADSIISGIKKQG